MRLIACMLCVLCVASVAYADEVPADQTPHADEVPAAPPVAQPCADAAVTARLGGLLRARRFADAHHAAVGLRVLCGDGAPIEWRLADDIALLRLEDRPVALADLDDLSHGARGELANAVLAWSYVSDRDHQAANTVLARLPAPRAAAISALGLLDDPDAFTARIHGLPTEQRARELLARYHDAHQKSPALAGVMSALLPGSGQIYAGSFQAAAVTFMLNSLFIGATVELALDKQWITAAAAGTAASFFYVGGVINAVDLARRRNRIAQQPIADELELLLVPELGGAY